MTKNEKRYLAGRVCMLCEMPLDRDSCGSMYGPKCSDEVIARRRAKCLANYKPRRRAIKPSAETEK